MHIMHNIQNWSEKINVDSQSFIYKVLHIILFFQMLFKFMTILQNTESFIKFEHHFALSPKTVERAISGK